MRRSTIVICSVALLALGCGGGSNEESGSDVSGVKDTAGNDGQVKSDMNTDLPGNDTYVPPSCIAIDRVESKVHPPSAVRVTFRVLDCNGYPVRYLTPTDMVVMNDEKGEAFGVGGEGGGASAPDVPSEFGFYSILTLDMSDSILNNNALDSVIDGAQIFVQKMVVDPKPDLRHQVALLVFGRTDATQFVLGFTDNATALHDKLEELRAGESLGTTNLYGAYMKALEEVMDVGTDLDLVERSVVILTDGTHEAGAEDELRQEALDAKKDAEDTGTLNVFSIGIKGNYAQEKLEELASKPDYFALADDAASLEEVFQDVAERVEAIAHSNYVVGVCTPVELGTPSLTIEVNVDGAVGDVTVEYPTDQLNGDVASCDWDSIAKPCKDFECGSGALPGFACGTCDACGTECLEGSCTFTVCEGKGCGDDGCGGACGTCLDGDECVDNHCVPGTCQPDCSEKECGDDGCEGSCGECPSAQDTCVDGACVCQPDCTEKNCGDDGCGGSCGECGPDEYCVNGVCDPECQPDCEGKECGPDGCGSICGYCAWDEECLDDEGSCALICIPDCEGKQCGDDGCYGECPPGCPENDLCVEGQCACHPDCFWKQCGDDSCGGSCGECLPGPDLTGKVEIVYMQVLLDGKVTVDFKITLANIGDAPCVSGSWWVDFWYEYPCDCDVHPANCNEQPNQSWVSGQDFDSLDGGASVELASEVILDSMPDEMRVVLFADSMFDFCAESYENNNLVCEDLPLQMAMADLAVQDCWIENSQDNPSSVTMSALVKNNSGLPTTQSVSIDFFLDGMSCSEPPFLEPGDTFGEVPPLNSGESILVEVTYPNLPPGMYEPVVLANGFQETPEVKTGNNCCATAPFLQAAFPP